MNQQNNPQTAGRYEGKHVKPAKPHRARRVLLIILAVLVGLALIAGATYLILYGVGKGNLVNYDNVNVGSPQSDSHVITYNDGKTVEYDGHKYQLNENITSIAFIGVDRKDISGSTLPGGGGQADSILVIAMDTKTGKTDIIVVSRDAYADVDVYSASGALIGTQQLQLCLSYAYGDGRETSCENTVKAVSQLLYGIPINSYIALDIAGIVAANDAVGGVTLTSISNLSLSDGSTLQVGEEITLHGKDAERYIRSRDHDALDANKERMERQKQYVKEFAKLVVQKSKSDLMLPVNLYSSLSDYMVSSLNLSDVTFLSSCFLQNGAQFEFQTIRGEYAELNGSAVCYLDETDLYQTLLKVFYNQAD